MRAPAWRFIIHPPPQRFAILLPGAFPALLASRSRAAHQLSLIAWLRGDLREQATLTLIRNLSAALVLGQTMATSDCASIRRRSMPAEMLMSRQASRPIWLTMAGSRTFPSKPTQV